MPLPGKIARVATVGAVLKTPPGSVVSSPASSPKRCGVETNSPGVSSFRDSTASRNLKIHTPGSEYEGVAGRAATPPPLTSSSVGVTSQFQSKTYNAKLLRTPTKPQLPKFLVRSMVVSLS